MPQARDIEFYPSALEKGIRSERALKLAIAEMYVQGVSTRKVQAVMEKLCGLEVSSSQVSRAAKMLDEELDKWRERPLGAFPYLILDARYEKVRSGGTVLSCALLALLVLRPVAALNVYIPSKSEQCFHEQVPKGDKVVSCTIEDDARRGKLARHDERIALTLAPLARSPPTWLPTVATSTSTWSSVILKAKSSTKPSAKQRDPSSSKLRARACIQCASIIA